MHMNSTSRHGAAIEQQYQGCFGALRVVRLLGYRNMSKPGTITRKPGSTITRPREISDFHGTKQ